MTAQEHCTIQRSLVVGGALANTGGQISSEEFLRDLASQLPGTKIYRLKPSPGLMMGAGFDWQLVLEVGANLVAVLGALWAAYEKFVKPLRDRGRSEAGLYVNLHLAPGKVVQVMIGSDVEDKDVFIASATEQVTRLTRELPDGTVEVAEAIERSGVWTRIQ